MTRLLKEKKVQPSKTVTRIVCHKCGELQVKIYPWANFLPPPQIPTCKKCQNAH